MTAYCCQLPPKRQDLRCDNCGDCARYERVAIMIAEGVPEDDAEGYCDTRPEFYGYRRKPDSQESLKLL